MLRATTQVTLLICLYLTSVVTSAGVISPKVKLQGSKSIATMKLDNSWTIEVDQCDSQMLFNAEYLQAHLLNEFNLSLSISSYNNTKYHSKNRNKKRILLGEISHPYIKKLISRENVVIDPMLGSEGYIIESFDDSSVLVVANEAAGIFYGTQSLLRQTPGKDTPFQLIYIKNSEVLLDGVYVADWPDKPVRGAHLTRERCTFLTASNQEKCLNESLMSIVDKMARWKMNYLVAGSRLPSQWLSPFTDLPTLHDYAKQFYIKPMPAIKGSGNAADLIVANPNIAEGIAVKNEQFMAVDDGSGRYVLESVIDVDQSSVLLNRGFESEVTTVTSANNPVWLFGVARVCPIIQPFCSNSEKISFQHWSWDTDVANAHTGSGSVKISVDKAWAEDYPISFSSRLAMKNDQYISVEAGKTYNISFWAKTSEMTGSGQVVIVQKDINKKNVAGTGAWINSASFNQGTRDWKRYFISLKASESTKYLELSSRILAGGYGTFWLDDFEIRRMDGALTNIIRTPSTDIQITSADGQTLYNEGSDYSVIDGEFNANTVADGVTYRFYPLNTPTQIELIPGGLISSEEPVLVKYDMALQLTKNAGTGLNGKAVYSVNESTTYKDSVCPYIENMMAELPSDYIFYMGSEVRGINRDSRNGAMENHELVAKNINEIYACAKNANPDVRIIIWDDMFNPWNNGDNVNYQALYGGKKGATEPKNALLGRVTDLIPRIDLIPAAWFYDAGDAKQILKNTPSYFQNLGFEWLAAPSYNGMNIQEWVSVIKDQPMNIGIIDTTWFNYEGLFKASNHIWNNNQNTIDVSEENKKGAVTGITSYSELSTQGYTYVKKMRLNK